MSLDAGDCVFRCLGESAGCLGGKHPLEGVVPRLQGKGGTEARLTPDAVGQSAAGHGQIRPSRLLKNPPMPRCCEFSEDRQEPNAGLMGCGSPISPHQAAAPRTSLGTPRGSKIGDAPVGRKGPTPFWARVLLGHLGRARGPFPSRASLLSHSPVQGCSFVAPPIFAPKNSRVTCVGSSTVC